MKTGIDYVLALVGVAGVVAALGQLGQAAEFVPSNTVIQINHVVEGGVAADIEQHIYDGSDDSGETPAYMPLGENGSTFELWADVEETGPKLVDTKFVGATMPTVEWLVTSEDPWSGVSDKILVGKRVERQLYRTRADKPYSVRATISISVEDPLDPNEVILQRDGFSANPYTYAPDEDHPYPLSAPSSAVMQNNGIFAWTGFPSLSTNGIDGGATRMVGLEVISVVTKANLPTLPGSLGVGQAVVQVWPQMRGFFAQIAENGTQEEFENGRKFSSSVDDIYVHYRDIYPATDAYVQIYKVTKFEGVTERVSASVLEVTSLRMSALTGITDQNGDAVEQIQPMSTPPQGLKIGLSSLAPYFNTWKDGIYQLAIRTSKLPFNPSDEAVYDLNHPLMEAVIEFEIDNIVEIRGTIGNVE